MHDNQAERKRKNGHNHHDELIEKSAREAVRLGHSEKVCPYVYDLKAKKIWLAEYRREKRRVRKFAA